MKKGILSLLTVLLIAFSAFAFTSCGGEQLEFVSNGDGTCTVFGKYNYNYTELVIPSVSPDGDTVTSIDSGFYKCKTLKSLTIPDSVTYIDDNAFADCTALTNVTLGSGLKEIGFSAFKGCTALTSITIPNSVEIIGSSAFEGCSGLKSIIIGSGVTEIGSYAFYGCSQLTNASFTKTVGWEAERTSLNGLGNPSTAATYLRETYYDCEWTCK